MSDDPKLVSVSENPLPEGAQTRWLHTHDGVKLRTAVWQSIGDAPRGTVLLLSGRTEFVEKYYECVADLRLRGYSVATMDWRGQGLSDRPLQSPRKGHVSDFELFVSDLRSFVEDLVAPHCPRPLYLLAHSMGGNIALRYLRDRPGFIERAVLSAPMTGIYTARIPEWFAHLCAIAQVGLGRGHVFVPGGAECDPLTELFVDNQVTHDQMRFNRQIATLRAEPALALGGSTWLWLLAALRSTRLVTRAEYARHITTPVLIVSAGNEEIVQNSSHQRMHKHLPHARHFTVPGAKHEILMEKDVYRDLFWHHFDDFIGSGRQ